MACRLEKIRTKLKKSHIDALLVTKRSNLRYLTGFTGEGACLVMNNDCFILTDSRYFEQAELQTRGCEVVCREKSLFEEVAALVEGLTVGFEPDSISYSGVQKLKGLLWKEPVPFKGWIEESRAVKSSLEKRFLRKAAMMADEVLNHVLGMLRPGVQEKEIAAELEYFTKKEKGADVSFDIIVLSGHRSSLPHGEPSRRKLKKNEIVLMDLGVVWKGYCSDLTRTVCVGKMTSEQKKVYGVVLEAQKQALECVSDGKKASDVALVSREVIEDAGFSPGHALGHGVGLEIHESPRIAKDSADIIREGMVFTIEPGIYLAGKFGIRIEDMVIAGKSGAEILTGSSRTIIEL